MSDKIDIQLDPYVNGYSLRVWVNYEKEINEIHEEKVEALKVIRTWIENLIIEELKRREQYAGRS